MGSEFIVPTGWVLGEYLECYKVTKEVFAHKVGWSAEAVARLLEGKEDLTEDLAYKLESIFTGVPATYWLNYELKYKAYIASKDALNLK